VDNTQFAEPDSPNQSHAPGDYPASTGKTTISPEVLLTILQLATLHVSGVSRMSPVPGGVNRMFKRGVGDGVRIMIRDDTVHVDLYVILQNDVNLRDVSRNIQHDVARAIAEMVGMQAGRINIHIEDIDYPDGSEANA